MANVIDRISCPSGIHEDKTPSCCVYDDGSSFCFSCQLFNPNHTTPIQVKIVVPTEDIEKKLSYISSLDRQAHRGLDFPVDKEGYYIVWPNQAYYKLRLWRGESRYKSPKGYKKPWLWLNGTVTGTIILVEGEINALSVKKAYSTYTVVSPGGVGDFNSKHALEEIPSLYDYKHIHIVVDSDTPGVNAAIKLKQKLHDKVNDIHIHLVEKDCNDLLVERGVKGIQDELAIETD